jgi:hypothetical protein
MSRRPPPGRLAVRQAKARMAPGGRLRSESPVTPLLPRIMATGASGAAALRWMDYPDTYRWADHPPTLTWGAMNTVDDLGVTL